MQDRLHNAAAMGDLNTIIQLRGQPGFDVNAPHSKYKTRAIDVAAQKGQLETLKYLIETLKAKIYDADKKPLLHWGLDSANFNVIKYIISKSKGPDFVPVQNVVPVIYSFIFDENAKKQEVFNLLCEAIQDGYDVNDRCKDDRTVLESMYCHVHDDSMKSKLTKIFLRHGAELRANSGGNMGRPIDRIVAFNNYATNECRKAALSETIIRAAEEDYIYIIKTLKYWNVSVQIVLKDIIDQLGDRQLKQSTLNKINRMLSNLVKETLLEQSEAQIIFKELEKHIDVSIDPSEYPKCLIEFLSGRVDQNRPSLEELILNLQFVRGIIPSPFTLKRLQEQNTPEAKDHISYKENHPELYRSKTLDEFVDPKNTMKALMELRTSDGIESCLCEAAIHPKVNKDVRYLCIRLLSRMENPTELEEGLLSVAEINNQTAKTLAGGIDELKEQITLQDKKLIKRDAKIENLSMKVEQLNNKLDTLLALFLSKNNNASSNNANNNDMDVDKKSNPFNFYKS